MEAGKKRARKERPRGGTGSGSGSGSGSGGTREADSEGTQWTKNIPLLYDWFASHHLVWQSLSCRWGPEIEDKKHKYTQRLYFSEQTDGSAPNTLVVAHVDVVKPRVAAGQDISKFDYKHRSPFVKRHKTIAHPGEVNRIRVLAQDGNIVLTHTDSPQVFLWNVETQPNSGDNTAPPVPDLILGGHTENAQFALATSHSAPHVISGGKDNTVLLWSVQDHISSSLQTGGTLLAGTKRKNGEQDEAEQKEEGTSEVTDVTRQNQESGARQNQESGASVGDQTNQEHSSDLSSADVTKTDEEGAAAAGAKAGAQASAPARLGEAPSSNQLLPRGIFKGHRKTVNDVQFHPTEETQFCSVGDDMQLLFWDTRVGGA